jgi:hypothetical protein
MMEHGADLSPLTLRQIVALDSPRMVARRLGRVSGGPFLRIGGGHKTWALPTPPHKAPEPLAGHAVEVPL